MDFGPLNASSIHYYGRKGKYIIDIARENISELIKKGLKNRPEAPPPPKEKTKLQINQSGSRGVGK